MFHLNKNNFLLKLLIFIICIIALSQNSLAIVSPKSNFYVNDYADILDSDTENYIININKELYEKCGAQIVVVTVKNLEGNSLEQYANTLFRNFGIGSRSKNNGVLLLLSLEERQVRIEVGYGLEGVLNDGKTGRILDEYVVPHFKNNNWNLGIKSGFNEILDVVCNEYNISISSKEEVDTNLTNKSALALFMIIIICVVILVLFINKNGGNSHGNYYRRGYSGRDSYGGSSSFRRWRIFSVAEDLLAEEEALEVFKIVIR